MTNMILLVVYLISAVLLFAFYLYNLINFCIERPSIFDVLTEYIYGKKGANK